MAKSHLEGVTRFVTINYTILQLILLNQISFIFCTVDEKRIDTNINYIDITNIAGYKVDRSMNGGPDYGWPKLITTFFSNSGLLGNQH
jgi:hypothetical protein